jgi:RNA polymerase sigma factor (sigma-70 family)
MAASQLSVVIQHLRRMVLLRDPVGFTDAQLLESFIQRREEAAFEAIVRRHGGMVMGVCRRILGSHHDAEDAFQATFLVLARKADSIARRESLAHWLYCVAYKTALKAKATSANRRLREREANMPKPDAMPPADLHELHALLDSELSRLPEKYRVAVVLCDLEGKARKEAAEQLGCPEGTVASRLARARAMLAKRLAQRGVVLSGAVLAGEESLGIASGSVPAPLIATTSKAAMLYAAGQAATGIVSTKVAGLAAAVLQGMVLTKVKTVTLAIVIGLATLGGGLLTYPGPVATPAAAQDARPDKAPKPLERRELQDNQGLAADGPRTDLHGDPLPAGAIMRLGTTRWRPGGMIKNLAFSPDGKRLASWHMEGGDHRRADDLGCGNRT